MEYNYYVWNIIKQGFLSCSVWEKFLSLEKFYTYTGGGVGDNYEVWSNTVKQTSVRPADRVHFLIVKYYKHS